MPVVGLLMGVADDAAGQVQAKAFRDGLAEIGFVVGRNVVVEYRWAAGRSDQLLEQTADLIRRNVAVIATNSNNVTSTAKAATATIPIVFAIGGDPVKMGLVASLNRPGGNITGISFLSAGTVTKRLALLHDVAPEVSDVAVLINPTNPSSEAELSEVHEAAHRLGLNPRVLMASSESQIDMAFGTLVQARTGALLVQGDPFFSARRRQIAALALRHGILAVGQSPDNADAGLLMTYGTNISDAMRIAGTYVGRILKGEKPADLPVQQTTRFELVINLVTAKALGVTVPPTLLAIADAVIE
jgi:putative ABC transport system substrate-binding protein